MLMFPKGRMIRPDEPKSTSAKRGGVLHRPLTQGDRFSPQDPFDVVSDSRKAAFADRSPQGNVGLRFCHRPADGRVSLTCLLVGDGLKGYLLANRRSDPGRRLGEG